MDQKLAQQSQAFEQNMDQKLAQQTQVFDQKLVQQSQEFQRYVGVMTEGFRHELSLVAESHQVLHAEIKETRAELKQDIALCNFKIDAVATDLKQHRQDTEAHNNIYCVKEV